MTTAESRRLLGRKRGLGSWKKGRRRAGREAELAAAAAAAASARLVARHDCNLRHPTGPRTMRTGTPSCQQVLGGSTVAFRYSLHTQLDPSTIFVPWWNACDGGGGRSSLTAQINIEGTGAPSDSNSVFRKPGVHGPPVLPFHSLFASLWHRDSESIDDGWGTSLGPATQAGLWQSPKRSLVSDHISLQAREDL